MVRDLIDLLDMLRQDAANASDCAEIFLGNDNIHDRSKFEHSHKLETALDQLDLTLIQVENYLNGLK